MMYLKKFLVVVLSVSLVGCSAMVPQSGRQWASCGKGAAIGGVGGAAMGAAIGGLAGGKKDAAAGALIGLATGMLAGCAIATELSARDEAELAAAEKRALESGEATTATWTNEEGKDREFQVAVEDLPTSSDRVCRRTRGQLNAGEQGAGETTRIYCRTADGDWAPDDSMA